MSDSSEIFSVQQKWSSPVCLSKPQESGGSSESDKCCRLHWDMGRHFCVALHCSEAVMTTSENSSRRTLEEQEFGWSNRHSWRIPKLSYAVLLQIWHISVPSSLKSHNLISKSQLKPGIQIASGLGQHT